MNTAKDLQLRLTERDSRRLKDMSRRMQRSADQLCQNIGPMVEAFLQLGAAFVALHEELQKYPEYQAILAELEEQDEP